MEFPGIEEKCVKRHSGRKYKGVMVVTNYSTKVLGQTRFRVFVIPRQRPANRALEASQRSWAAFPMTFRSSSLPLHSIGITAAPVSTIVGMELKRHFLGHRP